MSESYRQEQGEDFVQICLVSMLLGMCKLYVSSPQIGLHNIFIYNLHQKSSKGIF